MNDLFGNPISEPVKDSKTHATGYATRPGSGPAGQTCGTCKFATRTGHSRKSYFKCMVIRHRWTHGPGTDILLKSPACSFWKAKNDQTA
jgi:hypothetical protein